MNRQVPLKFALPVVAAVLALCAFVYSRLPTGMVVHMTAKRGGGGPGAGPGRMPMMRRPVGPKGKTAVLKKPEAKLGAPKKEPAAKSTSPAG